MSFVSFDFKCPNCGHVESRFVRRDQMDAQLCHCSTAKIRTLGPMQRLPAGTRTTFKFADTNFK